MTDRIEFYMPDIDYSNKFDVPKELWNSWGLDARATFNRHYEMMAENTHDVGFPEILSDEICKTIAWNSACLAAQSREHMEGY